MHKKPKTNQPTTPLYNSKNYAWLVLSQPGPLCGNISRSDSTAERAEQQEPESRTGQYLGKGEGK